jgi:hypothetical protein
MFLNSSEDTGTGTAGTEETLIATSEHHSDHAALPLSHATLLNDNEATQTETQARRQPDTSLARGVGLGVKFVKHLENNRRAKLVGSYIEIDVTHPDFESRVSSRNGSPRLTERLLGYIANMVSAAYRSSVHNAAAGSSHTNNGSSNLEASDSSSMFEHQPSGSSSETVYDEMLDTIVESSTKLEEKLQKRLPALQKEIDHLLMSSAPAQEEEPDKSII